MSHGVFRGFHTAKRHLTNILESVIDRVLHPELRDRMILLRGKLLPLRGVITNVIGADKYDLVDLLVEMRWAITIHGDDVLAHQNWELSEAFVRKFRYVSIYSLFSRSCRFNVRYSYLIDPSLLKIVNRWRRERGDQEIILPEEGQPE